MKGVFGKVSSALGGALGGSALASLLVGCCGAPWVVSVLGVSGAVYFARAAFLAPYLVGASLLLLVVAFWWAYRPPQRVCDSGVCEQARSPALRTFVWVAAVLVLSLLGYSFFTDGTPYVS
jgi:MerT mercuric transport protein